jgi:signal transduction histidine kinase
VRTRIIGLAVWCSLLAIVLFGVPLAAAVLQYAVQDARSELARTAREVAIDVSGAVDQHDVDDGDVEDALDDEDDDIQVAVYGQDGTWLAGARPDGHGEEITEALDGSGSSGSDADNYVVAVPVTHAANVIGVVEARSPRSAVWMWVVPVWGAMAGLAALALAAAWVVGRRMARRLSDPLEGLAATAHQLGEGDFSVRSRPGGVPEIDSVGAALDSTALRLDDLIARERAFSADVSHQLRTPLAGLRLRLEDALDRPDRELRPAVLASLGDADRLTAIIDELLALARAPRSAQAAPVDLPELVTELLPGWRSRLAAQGRDVELLVAPGSPAALASAAALRQVLAVLVDNATTHGAGTVQVTVRAASGAVAVDVADEGPGVSQPAPVLFTRRADQRDGHGIGLALARRLAEAEGGRLDLTHAAPPVFTLLVPAARGAVVDEQDLPDQVGGEVLSSEVPAPRSPISSR